MTLNGAHTIAELRDLMNAYDSQFSALSQAFDAAAASWHAADDAGATQWKADFDAWNAGSWQPARDHANTVLAGTSTVLQDIETDESTYQATAAAFAPMTDLDRRFRQAPTQVAAKAPTYADTPQPVAHDADLGAYKATDAATRAMPNVIKTAIATAAPGLVPKTADQSNYKALTGTQWALIIGGTVVGLGVILKIAK